MMDKLECSAEFPDRKVRQQWMKVILDVFDKLPAEVQKRLQKQVALFLAYNASGTSEKSRKKMIYFNCYLMDLGEIPIWVKKYVVAYEFAHAYSGSHSRKAIRSLMDEWGFDYHDFHERYHKWKIINDMKTSIKE